MIIDERTYDLHPGKLKEWMAIYQEFGLPVQSRILGGLVGFFTIDVGTVNQIVHLWRYDSHAERERRRAELAANADWQDYLAKSTPLVQRMRNRILTPLPFSPMK